MEKINFGLFFGHLTAYLFIWVFSLTAQGAFTAWMSNYYGDDTAKRAGRISFSPFVQCDLIGTVLLPIIAFSLSWFSAGIPLFAWGKQVPINSENFENPKTAGVMVTLASTFSSILIAVLSLAVLKLLFVAGIADAQSFLHIITGKNQTADVSWFAPIQLILWYGLLLNIALTVFSLIPIPPFNGGRVLFSFLPESFNPVKDFFNRFGLLIALGLIYFGVFGFIFAPIINNLVRFLVSQ
jgi:Zn-dependent protease